MSFRTNHGLTSRTDNGSDRGRCYCNVSSTSVDVDVPTTMASITERGSSEINVHRVLSTWWSNYDWWMRGRRDNYLMNSTHGSNYLVPSRRHDNFPDDTRPGSGCDKSFFVEDFSFWAISFLVSKIMNFNWNSVWADK